MNLGEGVTNLPRTSSRFMGFVTCLTQVHFPWMQKKSPSFLNYAHYHSIHTLCWRLDIIKDSNSLLKLCSCKTIMSSFADNYVENFFSMSEIWTDKPWELVIPNENISNWIFFSLNPPKYCIHQRGLMVTWLIIDLHFTPPSATLLFPLLCFTRIHVLTDNSPQLKISLRLL